MEDETARHVTRISDMRNTNTYNILVGKPEGKKPNGRSNCRPEDNIKVDLKQGWACGPDSSGLE
jgi:hypothetical protein